MVRETDALRNGQRRAHKKGIALVMAFSISVLLLGIIASLYWITVQRHTLMRKRAEHARALYLAEAGMNDAIARLRIGAPPFGINPAVGGSYCLDITNSLTVPFPPNAPSVCTEVCDFGQVRVCVSDNLPPAGRNQIDVTANW